LALAYLVSRSDDILNESISERELFEGINDVLNKFGLEAEKAEDAVRDAIKHIESLKEKIKKIFDEGIRRKRILKGLEAIERSIAAKVKSQRA